MAPRKKKVQATADDHADDIIGLLRESYQVLKEFHQTVTQKARNLSPNRLASATYISTFAKLLDHFKIIMDHQVGQRLLWLGDMTGDQRDNTRLVMECSGMCDFFRYQIACLYSLPLKNIFLPLRSMFLVKSSPILGLMNYIYHVKLEECQAPSLAGPRPRTHFKADAREVGQSWESILAAFGEGIRLYMNNAQHGSKLSQFQVLVGKVFYPFLAQVAGLPRSSNPLTPSEHVKRAVSNLFCLLLDAGEALSGACTENKELIRDPTIFGPAVLSHNISSHHDFITANIALQLAFSVAPPFQLGKGNPKSAKDPMEARTARENWFKQIFPVEEFGKSFQEQMVSRLVSMSSKHFWAGLGDIQEMIFQNDKSRACALPIQTGAVSENQIRFNAYAVPILQKTIQFNQSSLTWSCLVSRQGGDSTNEDEETTAEICYDAIVVVRLTGAPKFPAPIPRRSNLQTEFEEATLSIDFRSDHPIKCYAPAVHYTPNNNTFLATLVLTLHPKYADVISRILNHRKIKFSHVASSGKPQQTDDDYEKKVVDVPSSPEVQRSVTKRKTSKVSISQELVCSWEAENCVAISAHPNLRQRVKSVQREAEIDSSREEVSRSVSEQQIDRRGPSTATESISKSSPTIFHTGCKTPSKRKHSAGIPSPVKTSPSDKRVNQGKKLKRIRIVESPTDSNLSPPVLQRKQGSENNAQKTPRSVTLPTCETKARIVPQLQSTSKNVDSREITGQKAPVSQRQNDINNIGDSNLARKHSSAPAETDSDEIIEPCSEPEDRTDHVKLISSDSIDDASEKIVEQSESGPNSRDDSDMEDRIEQDDPEIRLPLSAKPACRININGNSTRKKSKDFGHLSVVNMAKGFRSTARKEEVHRPQKAEIKSSKDSYDAMTGRHEDWNRKNVPGSKQDIISSGESRAKRDTSSPDVHIVKKTDLDQDVFKQAKHRINAAHRKKPNKTKPQQESRLCDLVQNLSSGRNKFPEQDEKNATFAHVMKTKDLADRSSSGKKTVQAPSSVSRVNFAAQDTSSIRSKSSLKHGNSRETGGFKSLKGIADVTESSSTPLSRMQPGSSERSKKSVESFANPPKQKRLRFESPQSFAIQRKTSSSRSEKRTLSPRDSLPQAGDNFRAGNEMLHSIKRTKIRSEILKGEDASKFALKPSTPSRSTPRLNLKDFQKNPEGRENSSSPVRELVPELPNASHQDSCPTGKVKHILLSQTRPFGMLVDGIRQKQAKIKDVVSDSRLGVITLTNNFLEEYDRKNEQLSDEISRCALQRREECKQHLDSVKQDRIKIEQDLDRAKNYIVERRKPREQDS
ncbi:hypothetical protein VP01_206g5 [Puccinia sorghi]|uniref:Uncharacterized protein n=1 Tax=Puccinia sorghi TaxID=27349 RepID=A0A0L6VB51_9BASI|nr:hypothetical protein VP01_206g5 [Puccinia sorghi]